jgi:hypothetical protein
MSMLRYLRSNVLCQAVSLVAILGTIHGLVRLANQSVNTYWSSRGDRDADAGTDLDFVTIHIESRLQ